MESTPLSQMPQQQKKRGNKSEKNKLQCEKYCRLYRNKFRDIPYLTSVELLLDQCARNTSTSNVTLVDVRTEEERQVSMIKGAISVEEFHRLQATADTGTISSCNDKEEQIVVTYCTIGYRSGLEARRLGLLYPHLKDQIYSLDGIVAFTHALGSTLTTNQQSSEEEPEEEEEEETTTCRNDTTKKPHHWNLIHPGTGAPTTQVHTFGWIWGCVDEEHFSHTHFSLPALLIRLLQVTIAIITCFCLRIKHFCLPPPPRRQHLDH
eukprot:Sro396_g134310.2  (264) ;mRNA; r:39528-40400